MCPYKCILHMRWRLYDRHLKSIGLGKFQRDTAVEKFREGKTWVLIATDLMGRGMDFKGLNCVINYDFPPTISSYIHRVGN